jgi:anti-sigma factor RsiW
MTHIAEDDLIAHALDEVEDRTRGAVDAHCETCAACRATLDEIRATLALAERAEVPARGEEYGAAVWEKLEPRLQEHTSAERAADVPLHGRAEALPPQSSSSRHSVVAAGLEPRTRVWLAAAATLVIAAGAYWVGRQSATPAPSIEVARETPAPVTGAIRERVVLAALGEHLDRTERTLVELVNAEDGGRVDISAEQAWARDLLEANRLYRQAAQGANAPALSQVLDDLEPVLLEIANSPARVTSEEFRALRERIEARSLVFKVRVTGADVRARQRALLRPGEL